MYILIHCEGPLPKLRLHWANKAQGQFNSSGCPKKGEWGKITRRGWFASLQRERESSGVPAKIPAEVLLHLRLSLVPLRHPGVQHRIGKLWHAEGFFCRKFKNSVTSICQGFSSMEAGRMEYVGERELLQYSVKEWRMEKTGDNVVKAVLKVDFLT